MGRQVLLAVLCWLSISLTFGDKKTHNAAIQDNVSEESAPRLYRNVPAGVYASAAPYGAYSFQLPAVAFAPKAAASQVVPVQQKFVNHLTDSYGNKFLGTPQLSTYKIAFPQQFVQLQTKLPEHLAQPLVAASANFQFKQSNGQFFGAPYRVPAIQGPSPTPLHQFPSFGQLYGDNVNNFAPSTVFHGFGVPNSQQQSSNNRAVFTNEQKSAKLKEPELVIGKPKVQGIQEISHLSKGEPKFQRIQDASHTHYGDPKFQRIQEGKPNSQHHGYYSSYDDEKFQRYHELPHYESKFQIIHDEHDSPQFEKIEEHHTPHEDVKSQHVQDVSPTIQSHGASYEHSQEKPQPAEHANNLQAAPAKQIVTYINDINGHKTVVELETKPNVPLLDLTLLEPLTFDNPLVPQVQHFLPRINQATYQKLPLPPKVTTKKKQKKPTHSKKNNDAPRNTGVTYHETLDEAPEIVYEINSPNTNYKETVKEKSLSYNKQTQSDPVTYSYGSKSEKEPVTYSYSRSSKDPAQLVQYHGNGPSHLIYTFKPEEQVHEKNVQNSAPHHSEEESESSRESDDDGPAYQHNHHNQHHQGDQYKERPKSAAQHHEPAPNSYHQKHHSGEQYDDHPKAAVQYHEPSHKTYHQQHHSGENYKQHPKSGGQHREPTHTTHHQQHHSGEQYNKHSKSAVENHHPTHKGHSHHQPQQHSGEYQEHPKSAVENLPVPHKNYNNPEQYHSGEQYKEHPQPAQQHHVPPHKGHNSQHSQHSGEQYNQHPKSSEEHSASTHKEKQSFPKEKQEKQLELVEDNPPKYQSEPAHFTSENIDFQPILKEYENNIRLLSTPSASIKVDPHQHIQPTKSTPESADDREEHSEQLHQQPHSSPAPEEHSHSSPDPQGHHPHSSSEIGIRPGPPAHIHEKSKRIIIHEEAPDGMHMLTEQMRAEVIKQEENNEEDFEKAYQDAALGFPAYSQKATDSEKDIFDPESYGAPHDHVAFDFENVPLQQYQEDGDEYPKETRASYKDARDRTKQNYYSDYSISKPESMLNRYQNKLGYYKLFKEQKPAYLKDEEDDDKKKQKSAKYSAAPSYSYFSTPEKGKDKQKSAKYSSAPAYDYYSQAKGKETQQSAKYTAAPIYDYPPRQDTAKAYYGYAKPKQQLYEYDYSKGGPRPRDSSAFASRPYQSYKSRTSFVEPQFQYGFEPVAIPKLLDSELAAMASNDSPESEKPGMRKKVYKENWYIKKTSTSAGVPAS